MFIKIPPVLFLLMLNIQVSYLIYSLNLKQCTFYVSRLRFSGICHQ